jgi:hypothetical protein
MEFHQQEALDRFQDAVETALMSEATRRDVVYPPGSIAGWVTATIDRANATLLEELTGRANLYALFAAPRGSTTFRLRYIGKSTRALARQRLRNHLIKKNDGTGAKLETVQAHIRSGGSLKVAWVSVTPESLRNYLEEQLISKYQQRGEADWNRPIR